MYALELLICGQSQITWQFVVGYFHIRCFGGIEDVQCLMNTWQRLSFFRIFLNFLKYSFDIIYGHYFVLLDDSYKDSLQICCRLILNIPTLSPYIYPHPKAQSRIMVGVMGSDEKRTTSRTTMNMFKASNVHYCPNVWLE